MQKKRNERKLHTIKIQILSIARKFEKEKYQSIQI